MGKLCFEIREDYLRGALFKDAKLVELRQVRFIRDLEKSNLDRVFSSLVEYFTKRHGNSEIREIRVCRSELFDNIDAKEVAKKKYLGEVRVVESIDCFVMGEYLFSGYGAERMAGIFFNSRPSARVIIEGKIIDKGHVVDNFEKRYNDSLLDDFTAGRNLVKIAAMRGVRVDDPGELYSRKYQGIWDEFSVHMAYVLFELIKLYEPQVIVIGGKVVNARAYFEKGMVAELNKISGEKIPSIRFEKKNTSLFGAAKV